MGRLLVFEKGRFRASLAIFHLYAWAKCDFWTKLLTKANYGRKNAQAREALKVWFAQVQLCTWSSHNDLLADFPTADYITQGRYVFDIKGNHYRLVAQVLFSLKTVDIRRIMTHAEYDKLSHKQLLKI